MSEIDYPVDTLIRKYFDAFDSNDPTASVTITGFALADIKIYKDGSTTERSSTAGYTLLGGTGIDFDGITGINGFSVDLSDNTDAGFFVAGSEYVIVINSVTIDGGAINFVAREFSIERTGGVLALMKDVPTTAEFEARTISATAAANLEDTYDGTGYPDDHAPATQAQLGQLSTGSAAISTAAESAVITTGTETLTYASTVQLDQAYHEVADVGGALDLYYQFDIGGNGVAVSATMTGRLNGNNDSVDIFAYNWGSTTWEQVFTLPGQISATDVTATINLLLAHTGTGANIGKVRIRAYQPSGLTSATFYLDQVYLSYSVVVAESGFENGMVWVDTVNGTAGTAKGIGIATNAVSNFTDAATIAAANNLYQYFITSNSVFAPSSDFNDVSVYGIGYTCDLGGHDYAGTHIYHASPVNGIATTAGATDHFDVLDSIIFVVTSDDAHFTNCIFKDTYTIGTSGILVNVTLDINHCKSGVPGAGAPEFIKTAGNALKMNVRDWQGGFNLSGLEAGDVGTIGGTELGTVTLAGSGGAIELRGIYKALDITGYSGTVNLDGAIKASDVADILVDTAPFNALLTLAAAAAGTLTATTMTTDLTETTDGHYIGRLITFTSGALAGQQTDVTGYTGSNKMLTFTALTEAPIAGTEFTLS